MEQHTADRLVIDVWADVVCPFCYLGHAALDRAIEGVAQRDAVDVRYRSFQLDPDLPDDTAVPVAEYLASKGLAAGEHSDEMHDRIRAQGAALGIEFRFDRALMANTRAAHRMVHLAGESQRSAAMVERLYRAQFTEGARVGDHDTLVGLAAEAGVDAGAARDVLDGRRFDDEIDADVVRAAKLGVTGVPFVVLGGTHAVSGAQPVELFGRALDAAWDAAWETSRG
ncbi:DSBA oxidoreductase [Pseudonocardia sulfidoxydans NBRC 16205]|uniref:DSBA oxidoreductase n=1 Tax=Pseudonocardia sulfidoxydans NBRC 16205 TaxID=1223511 RepID=A0A511DPB0_9PSEU|nr:DsbA family oxidoreductase [Pseudonocardia sulfidoxydans]GEL25634.1 DSBA oxidoreductase [Pseudonocardia sulfidoxydans NBRC 16205]